jgi:hypothetical protein
VKTAEQKREYPREWNRKNSEKRRANKLKYRSKPGIRAKEAGYERRRRQLNWARLISDAYKIAPCCDCGQQYPAMVMEFDHRDPETKSEEIAVLVRKRPLPSVLFAEIAKCDLVCANCHRMRTLTRQFARQIPTEG